MSRVIAASILLSLLFCLGALAQPTGTITGTVADESGAVIPNVTVTITNPATGFSRTAKTNAEGYFSASAIPAGQYDVKAEVTGFRTSTRPTTVQAGETTQVNMPMTLGETSSRCERRGGNCSDQLRDAQHYRRHPAQRDSEHPAERSQLPAIGRASARRHHWQRNGIAVQCAVHGQRHGIWQPHRHYHRRRQCFRQHRCRRRHVLHELLPRRRAGISTLGSQFRYRHSDLRRGRHQRRDPLWHQRLAWQRLFLLPRPQHGGLSEPAGVFRASILPSSSAAIRASLSADPSKGTSCSSSSTTSS